MPFNHLKKSTEIIFSCDRLIRNWTCLNKWTFCDFPLCAAVIFFSFRILQWHRWPDLPLLEVWRNITPSQMPERSVEPSPCWPFVASFSHPPSQLHRSYLALITHLGRCCFHHQNLDRICLCLTGGPWKCPQLCPRPLPEHAARHHEAYRRATSVFAATDAGIFPTVPHVL